MQRGPLGKPNERHRYLSLGTNVSLTVLDPERASLAMCIEPNIVLCHGVTLPP